MTSDKALRMPQASLGWLTANISLATQQWDITGGLLAAMGYKLDVGNTQLIPLPWQAIGGHPLVAHPLRWLVYAASTENAVLYPTPQLMGHDNLIASRKSVTRKSISGATLNPTGAYFRVTSSSSTVQVTDRYYCWAVIRPTIVFTPTNPTIDWLVAADLQTAIVRF